MLVVLSSYMISLYVYVTVIVGTAFGIHWVVGLSVFLGSGRQSVRLDWGNWSWELGNSLGSASTLWGRQLGVACALNSEAVLGTWDSHWDSQILVSDCSGELQLSNG